MFYDIAFKAMSSAVYLCMRIGLKIVVKTVIERELLILFFLSQFNVSFYLFYTEMMFYFIFLVSHVAIIDIF